MNIRAEIDQIMGQIEEIECLFVNRGSKCTNSEPITKMKRWPT
jgi:hypothetical protein